jgi:hypothetical protein
VAGSQCTRFSVPNSEQRGCNHKGAAEVWRDRVSGSGRKEGQLCVSSPLSQKPLEDRSSARRSRHLLMSVADQVAAVAAMKPACLREEWGRLQRTPLPGSFGPDLLARALAYSLQEKAAGGLSNKVLREIRRGVFELNAKSVAPDRSPALRLGTRLTREWHGRTHHVEVVEGGFEYEGQRFRSLTAIAHRITGARWSGPRFFGIVGRRGG